MGTEWSLSFSLRLALGALSLEASLETREPWIALVGPSGAGKSTLLRILAGVEERATGRLEVNGRTWLEGTRIVVPAWERRVGWVPQDALLFPHLSVERNLRASGEHDGAPPFDELVKLLGLDALLHRSPRHLSGGERQRVALGRALLSAPALLLLDEPFAALDRPLRRRLTTTLLELRARWPVPTVLVSHDVEDVSQLATGSWTLVEGRLQRSEDPPRQGDTL